MAITSKILGLITARGGSKRLPGKNIREFLGRPLLAWTIDTAKKSGVLDRLILSTDDLAIADIGRRYSAEIPFMRPPELATDTASSFSVVQYTVDRLKKDEGYVAPWIILFEPTSPGRQPFHIREVADVMKAGTCDTILGVSEMPGHYNPFKAFGMSPENTLARWHDAKPVKEVLGVLRNQDMPKSYFLNSSIYAFKTANLYENDPNLWGRNVYGYVMDYKYSMDIDTAEEWKIAEMKMRAVLSESEEGVLV